VLGKIKAALTSPVIVADAGNAGSAAFTALSLGPKAVGGAYEIKCTVATVASPVTEPVFEVRTPDGVLLGTRVGYGAFASQHINFTVGGASPVEVIGDKWTFNVAAGSGAVTVLDPDAVDGSDDFYGILTDDCDATLGAKKAVAVVRDAVIIPANLVWKATSPALSAAQKEVVLAAMEAKGIITRAEG
jgi:hypothetical protein